jgi:hypothetical protein
MPSKSNQKSQEVKPDKKTVAKPIFAPQKLEPDSEDKSQLGFAASLNEELDEHLKKNAKRFFGGCG